MKTTLKPEFVMTSEEIANYNSLPDNMPDTKLTAKQKELVSELYYKYIGKRIDNQDWGKPMFKVEMEEKWPSGPRMKQHEAQRIILNNLVDANEKKEMTNDQAVSLFHCALTARPMWAKLLNKIYSVNGQ